MVVYTSGRKQVRLGHEIGGGGEAVVYRVLGRSDLLAKIYRPAPLSGYDQKLAWLLAHPPDNPTRSLGHASIAWPLDLLYNGRGRFVGYLMPYIQNAVPLLNVFNPRRRARMLPGFNGRYLHRTAHNLAATLEALHQRGYLVGDLNESNVMVTPSAMVTIIDVDSFQVQEQSGARLIIYPCPVGKPEYTPPELQGRPLQGIQQLPEHDRFGLGVLIFQLLMGGSHPFRARWLRGDDPPPVEERIRRGCFPYSPSPSCPVAPPRSLSLDRLHPRLAELVRRCFVAGHQDPRQRPTAGEWKAALAEAEKALVTCRNGHDYSGHLRACPRCNAKRPVKPVSRPRPAPPPPTPSSAATTCSHCGTSNAPDALYCQQCDAPLQPQTCSRCGYAQVPGQAMRCPRCGEVV